MARAIRWQVPFTSIDGTSYTINIYEDDWTGAATNLLGAATPIETSEDDDEDFFRPVRTSSGTLRVIIRSSSEFSSLIPQYATHHYVTLVDDDGNTHWQGFMQPSTFTQTWGPLPQEAEFPLISPLGILDGVNISQDNVLWSKYGGTSSCYIAQLIMEMVDATKGVYDYFVLPHRYDMSYELLGMKISRKLWLSENNEDDDGSGDWLPWTAKPLSTVLEDIANYMGWEVREQGRTLFFGGVDINCSHIRYTLQDIDEIAQGREPQYSAYTKSYNDISDYTMMSANHKESYIPGKKKIVINADFGANESVVPWPTIKKLKSKNTEWIGSSYGRRLIFPGSWILVRQYAPKTSSSDYQCVYDNIREICDTSGDYGGYTNDEIMNVYGPNPGLGSNVGACILSETHDEDKVSFIDYVFLSGDSNMQLLSLFSHGFVSVPYGCFVIAGTVKQRGNGYTLNSPTGNLIVALRCGNRYYNGSSWQTSECTFTVGFSNGSINNTNTLKSGYDDADGYIVPIDSYMAGDVELRIYGEELTNLPCWSDIRAVSNLTVTFCPLSSERLANAEKDKNVYAVLLDKGFSDEYEKDLNIATYQENSAGNGFLLNSGNTIAIQITDVQGNEVVPEELNLARYKAFFNRIYRKLEIDIDYANELSRDPLTVLMADDGRDYAIIAMSNDYINNKQRLTLMQLPG